MGGKFTRENWAKKEKGLVGPKNLSFNFFRYLHHPGNSLVSI
jgi:hypothetical protein